MPLADNRAARWAVALVALVVVGQTQATPAQAELAVAEAITDAEIEQRTRLWANVPGKPYTHEQVVAELRDEKRKIREAKEAGVNVSSADIDLEYAQMARRMNVTVERMNENLEEAGLGPETIKHRIHADIAWQRYQKIKPQQ